VENPEARCASQVSAPTYEDGRCIVTLTGELDAARVPLLQQALAPIVVAPEVTCLVLDMAAVPFVESTGWRVLLQAGVALAKRGAELRLSPCPPNLVKVLEETRMNLLFDRIP